MRTSDYDYELPKELIAQYPAERRDESRLLVLGREDGRIEHRIFRDLVEYVRPGDVLVANESAVIPARFIGQKRRSGGRVEMFLLRELSPTLWEVLLKPGARIREGTVLEFGDGALTARVGATLAGGKREVELAAPGGQTAGAGSGRDGAQADAGTLRELLDELGRVPLPPYIEREAEELDRDRYQTVYARVRGAVAAPTAGLHFTNEVIEKIEARGAAFAKVTLHVGLGTFRPVSGDDPSEHEMEEERYELGHAAAESINRARSGGGRIVAVGTTSVRVLETVADESGVVRPGSGATRLFIRPPHAFRAVDALLTNFHLPRSTLLMLVSALAGRENVLAAYREAVRERYRFYSYGDAMLIV
ncbi:MAG: tRNA preQ1(34) S-adenosylmethionine ribosyltransferase-isomerase QueA [Candidatus Eisenbacteria bacterium]